MTDPPRTRGGSAADRLWLNGEDEDSMSGTQRSAKKIAKERGKLDRKLAKMQRKVAKMQRKFEKKRDELERRLRALTAEKPAAVKKAKPSASRRGVAAKRPAAKPALDLSEAGSAPAPLPPASIYDPARASGSALGS